MNYKDNKYLKDKMQSQIAVAQKIAEERFKMVAINQPKDLNNGDPKPDISSNNNDNDIIKKLDNIEKLLRELVDINYTALHLAINGSKENSDFFQKKTQEK